MKKDKYCPSCKKEVRIKKESITLKTFFGFFLILFGGFPGKKQSETKMKCSLCDGIIPEK